MSDRSCSIEGCGKPVRNRGWCAMHYSRWKRTGDPLKVKRIWKLDGLSPVERVDRFIERQPNGCWHWAGYIDANGYGRRGTNGGSDWAHRAVYEAYVGPIPDGLHLDHLCHTNDPACVAGSACLHRRCVNPAHLEPVTREENTRRAHFGRQTHCKHGHEFTPENTIRRPKGGRKCRACARATNRAYEARKKAAK